MCAHGIRGIKGLCGVGNYTGIKILGRSTPKVPRSQESGAIWFWHEMPSYVRSIVKDN